MRADFDVDIDFRTDFNPLDVFPNGVLASRVSGGELVKHQVGVYLQGMAVDPLTGLAAIPYEEAERLGFIKIDMLHLSLLDNFNDKGEIRALLRRAPDWRLLEDKTVVGRLFQLHRHYDVVARVKPRSVIELADTIALIRPGKRWLLESYLKDRKAIRDGALYKKTEDGSNYFKRSHAVAYALNVVLQLHLIKAGIL
jgi:hypothetical protein